MTDLSRNPISGQQLPHSLEAEQAVLGGLMLANELFDTVAAVLREEDFHSQDHRLIFKTMHRLAAGDKQLSNTSQMGGRISLQNNFIWPSYGNSLQGRQKITQFQARLWR